MKNDTCIPAKTVAIDGTSPAVGDEVEVSLKGKVTRVDGEQLYFQPESANGEPIAMSGDDEAAEGEMPTEESLRKSAEEEDQASITA
jgi:hypothetical protein